MKSLALQIFDPTDLSPSLPSSVDWNESFDQAARLRRRPKPLFRRAEEKTACPEMANAAESFSTLFYRTPKGKKAICCTMRTHRLELFR